MRFKRRSRLPLYNYTGEMRSLVIALKIRSFRYAGWQVGKENYDDLCVLAGVFDYSE